MAVRQRYETQEEIPQGLREHYLEKDGAWILQTDPVMEDVTGLKTALNTERGLRRDAEKQVTDLKVKFEGIEPEEVTRLRDRVKGLDDADVYDKQGIEVLVNRRTESMKADHERVVRLKDTENTKLREANTELDRRWRQDRIKTALLDVATRSGVPKYAIPDAVQRGLTVFSDLDEDGNVVARSGEDIRYGKDGIHPLSPEEWLSTLKQSGEAPHLWPPSSGGGAPASHGGNGQGTDWSKITNPAERLTAYRQSQANKT